MKEYVVIVHYHVRAHCNQWAMRKVRRYTANPVYRETQRLMDRSPVRADVRPFMWSSAEMEL